VRIVSQPLLNGRNLFFTHHRGAAQPEQVAYGSRVGKDFLALGVFDANIERVVERIKENLDQVWVCGKLAQGLESDVIEVVLVGSDVDEEYIAELMGKVAEVVEKQIDYKVLSNMSEEKRSECLLIWEKAGKK